MANCIQSQFAFEAHFSRHVVAHFDGGQISTEGGAPQVRLTPRRIWIRYSRSYPWKHVYTAAWPALRC